MKPAISGEMVFASRQVAIIFTRKFTNQLEQSLSLAGDYLHTDVIQPPEAGSGLLYHVAWKLHLVSTADRDLLLQVAKKAKDDVKPGRHGRIEAHDCRHDDGLPCELPIYQEEWNAAP